MTEKRSADEFKDFVPHKMLKRMEDVDEDVTLDNYNLSEDVKCSLEYDVLLKTFSVTFEKTRKDGNRSVCVGEEEIKNIIKFLPVIKKLVDRYSSKRTPKPIDIPFEAGYGEVGDLITVVSLKENTYRRGVFDVDIRKCVKKEEGAYQYTSEGVRVAVSLLTAIKEKLDGYQSCIYQAIEKSKEVIATTTAIFMIREIQQLSDPRQNCPGCHIDHPSQKEHMGYDGCLSPDQPEWKEICNQYWQAAKNLIQDDEVHTLAKQAVFHILELQNTFIPGLVSSENIPECMVKDIVLKKDEMVDVSLF